jgi:ATP-dependent exoDNAse (exonuclease V) alpha subunit
MRELMTGSKDKVRMLNGEAGTGKSVCISVLVDKLITKYGSSSIAVVAPSADAVTNLQLILGDKIQVTTAHQHFGFGGNNGFDKKRSNFYYRKPSAIIVDEVSTLPDYLMDEIYKHKIQAFLFGDKFQLQAVSNPPNLDTVYTVSLEEQMRQDTSTTLYKYVKELRRAVIEEDDSKFAETIDGSLSLFNSESDFNKELLNDSGSHLMVAFTHDTLDTSPTKVKSTIHKSQGQSVDTVYVDMRDFHANYLEDDTFRRLFYVALSRAKKKAVILNYVN